MKRPPTIFRSPSLACVTCGAPVRTSTVGGFEHVRRLLHRDWHPVVWYDPAFDAAFDSTYRR